MTNAQDKQRVIEALHEIAQYSPGNPIKVDTISRTTGIAASELQPVLKALFEVGELRELIGDRPIKAVVVDD